MGDSRARIQEVKLLLRRRGPAQSATSYGQRSTAVTTCVRRTDNGLNWFHFSRADTAQEPPQEIGSSDYALLCSPYQDQVVVNDIVLGMFRLNLHAPDHFAQTACAYPLQ